MFARAAYENIIRPILFRFDAEETHAWVHDIAISGKAIWPLLHPIFNFQCPPLGCTLANVMLKNPVGLAAGFDKNGDLVEVLGHLGFGFAEIGSVTAQARPGNKKPRLFRLPQDEALINWLGLNSRGADIVFEQLKQRKFSLPIGLNIAKTNDPQISGDAAIEDMLYSFNRLKDLPVFYITVNASCPNTEEGIMTEMRVLNSVFAEMQKTNVRRLPIFVKISPDSSDQLLNDIVEIAITHNLAGFVSVNGSTSRANLLTAKSKIERFGQGGLTGSPLKKLGLSLCQKIYKLKSKEQVLIGCGGISSGQDAYDYIRAGCTAVQLYTGLVYHGPTLPADINRELAELLRRDRLTVTDAVGLDDARTSAPTRST
jgi:dihydroorotate dehydrogenase